MSRRLRSPLPSNFLALFSTSCRVHLLEDKFYGTLSVLYTSARYYSVRDGVILDRRWQWFQRPDFFLDVMIDSSSAIEVNGRVRVLPMHVLVHTFETSSRTSASPMASAVDIAVYTFLRLPTLGSFFGLFAKHFSKIPYGGADVCLKPRLSTAGTGACRFPSCSMRPVLYSSSRDIELLGYSPNELFVAVQCHLQHSRLF